MKDTHASTPEQFAAWVRQAKNGAQDAFTQLYESTCQETYRTIRAMVRSEELALDIQQEVYVQAFTHLEQLNEPDKFRPWLRTIAVNQTRSALRRQTPALFSELCDEEGSAMPELVDLSPDVSPELKLEQKETATYLREILDGLTPGQRVLVALYYYEQLPISQIARALEITPGTVKTQLSRSRKKIEAGVRQLEQRGVKLYGLSPLPFLLALLRQQKPAAGVQEAILTRALPETVAVHVGRRFFETVAGRILLGLLTAAAIGGGLAGWSWWQARQSRTMGDYQPAEVETVLTDSAEDLSTEPPASTDATGEDATEVCESEEDLTEPPASTAPTEPPTPTESAASTEPPTPTAPPQPSQPPAPTQPQPTSPPEPTSPPAPTEAPPEEPPAPASSEAETAAETLPLQSPYPDNLGEVTVPYSWDRNWIYTFETDRELQVSQFIRGAGTPSGILVDTFYSDGRQTVVVQPRAVGTCVVSVSRDGIFWVDLVTLHVTDEADETPNKLD